MTSIPTTVFTKLLTVSVFTEKQEKQGQHIAPNYMIAHWTNGWHKNVFKNDCCYFTNAYARESKECKETFLTCSRTSTTHPRTIIINNNCGTKYVVYFKYYLLHLQFTCKIFFNWHLVSESKKSYARTKIPDQRTNVSKTIPKKLEKLSWQIWRICY